MVRIDFKIGYVRISHRFGKEDSPAETALLQMTERLKKYTARIEQDLHAARDNLTTLAYGVASNRVVAEAVRDLDACIHADQSMVNFNVGLSNLLSGFSILNGKVITVSARDLCQNRVRLEKALTTIKFELNENWIRRQYRGEDTTVLLSIESDMSNFQKRLEIIENEVRQTVKIRQYGLFTFMKTSHRKPTP